jgi:two-component system chemotaxis response regulator CheY
VVEDEFSARKLLEAMLSDYGTCDIATDGNEAVAAVKTALAEDREYDLICLDIMMPDMDGQEALKKIRELETEKGIWPGKGAKIIMTTALHDASNIMTAFMEQCESYLVKPIEKELLTAELKKLELIP